MKLSVRDAAKALSVDEETVYRWVKSGTLPSIRVSDQYRLSSSDLLEWATAHGHRLDVEALNLSGDDLPTLSTALRSGGLHHYEGPPERGEVLKAMVEALPVDEAERPLLHELLTARECLGSTGIGEGIGIPHVRAPLIVHGVVGSMALWYLPAAVDFVAPDGKPVDTLFFLITSSSRVHLHLLSRLAAALHEEPFRQALRRRADLEALVALTAPLEGGAGGRP